MVQRITSSEYLKRYDNMTAEECRALSGRVGEWLQGGARLLARLAETPAARLQNVLQVSIGWNDRECQAWTEGVRLLTAFAGKADTWLPEMLYVKAARRSIGQMTDVLRSMASVQAAELRETVAKKEPAEGTIKATQAVATFQGAAADGGVGKGNHGGEERPSDAKAAPVRPRHIDQYIHLLPEKTQERAAMYGPLMRELDVARQKMALLMDDPHASAESREGWAKTAMKLDTKIKAIRKELDAEWDKLVEQGRVVVDDLGNAHVVEPDVPRQETEQAAAGNKAKAAENAKRIEYLKKWLRDTRTKASDKRRKQWEENCRELLSLGGEITDSIRQAAEHYGVKLDAM